MTEALRYRSELLGDNQPVPNGHQEGAWSAREAPAAAKALGQRMVEALRDAPAIAAGATIEYRLTLHRADGGGLITEIGRDARVARHEPGGTPVLTSAWQTWCKAPLSPGARLRQPPGGNGRPWADWCEAAAREALATMTGGGTDAR